MSHAGISAVDGDIHSVDIAGTRGRKEDCCYIELSILTISFKRYTGLGHLPEVVGIQCLSRKVCVEVARAEFQKRYNGLESRFESASSRYKALEHWETVLRLMPGG